MTKSDKKWLLGIIVTVVIGAAGLVFSGAQKQDVSASNAETVVTAQAGGDVAIAITNGASQEQVEEIAAEILDKAVKDIVIVNVELRALSPLENEKKIKDLGDNWYGFVSGSSLAWGEMYDESVSVSDSFTYSEIQNIEGELFLVGFVGEETYSLLGEFEKGKAKKIVFHPVKNRYGSNLIMIPFEDMKVLGSRSIPIAKTEESSRDETIIVLDLEISSVVRTSVESHKKHDLISYINENPSAKRIRLIKR